MGASPAPNRDDAAAALACQPAVHVEGPVVISYRERLVYAAVEFLRRRTDANFVDDGGRWESADQLYQQAVELLAIDAIYESPVGAQAFRAALGGGSSPAP